MKITFIAVSASQLNLGVRTLSSLLKERGHKVNIVFFRSTEKGSKQAGRYYNDKVLHDLLSIIEDSDIIGLSFMTMNSGEAEEVGRFLKKKLQKPIIAGGIHSTLCPEEVIDYADFVFLGESEETLLEFMEKYEKGEDCSSIRGLWSRKNGEIIKNDVRVLIEDLDKYPFPDFLPDNKWAVKDGKLNFFKKEDMHEYFKSTFWFTKDNRNLNNYIMMTTRGCPHRCSYCSNALYLDMFKCKGKIVRFKSPQRIIEEIEHIKKLYPFINFVFFYDDTFFIRSEEEIVKFSKHYKNRINLPFAALASPQTISDEKIKAMVGAGMKDLQVGIESGSERINFEIFNRKIKNDFTLGKMKILNRYKRFFIPRYDFIVDVPYDIDRDRLETLKFLGIIPRPFRVMVFSLVVYPHTEIHKMLIEDGILNEKLMGVEKNLNKMKNLDEISYYQIMVMFSPFIPKLLYKILTSWLVFKILNLKIFSGILKLVLFIARKINRIIHINRTYVRGLG